MIEIRQNEKTEQTKDKDTSCQPKNFRQIGTPKGEQKIYFEDYVYTYLHPMFETEEEDRICVLLGRVVKEKNLHYIFVNGAAELAGVEFAGGAPILTEKTREEICALIKKHFDGSCLVGWYLDRKGETPKLTPELERLHRNFFGGRDKIALLSDSLNREEKLFACDNNVIRQKEGYYIYYEKNPSMQEYMIGTRETAEHNAQPERVKDDALKNYRELLLQKEEKKARPIHAAFYATAFLMVLTVCVLGVNMLNNYEKMTKIEGAISVLSDSVGTEQATAVAATETEEQVVVIESVAGNVVKQEDTQTETEPATEITVQQEAEETQLAEQRLGAQEEPAVQEQTAVNTTQEAPVVSEEPVKAEEQQAASEIQGAEVMAQDTPAEPEAPELTESETIRLQGYYIVQKGENLAAIIRKIYGTTENMDAVCEKNGIDDSNAIYAGQKLLLP